MKPIKYTKEKAEDMASSKFCQKCGGHGNFCNVAKVKGKDGQEGYISVCGLCQLEGF